MPSASGAWVSTTVSPASTLALALTSTKTIQPAPPPRSQAGAASAQLLLAQSATGWRRFTASVRAAWIEVTRSLAAAAMRLVAMKSVNDGMPKPSTMPAIIRVIISSSRL
ncbi:MAG: hypothetical protein EDM71_07280 [Proteobacteria bacterium]|nr:MAG: hypothetical protein EDM71_07280 [Pseudomonadota bacterium]